jgi:DNA sulfur modification protein DndB
MDARFVINDGQHRRAAFEQALRENPDLGDETIAVVFFLDIGLKRSQQMFTDLNRYTVHPDPSLNILYDSRDRKSILSKSIVKEVKIFDRLTDMERSNLPVRSSKLFTLSSIYSATQALLVNHKDKDLEQQIAIGVRFWQSVSNNLPDWQQVFDKKVSPGEIRREYIHSHAVTLAGIGGAGAVLLATHPDKWETQLKALRKIDWSRSNPDWEGRVMYGGRLSKSRTCVSFMIAYLKNVMKLPLSTEEERLENIYALSGR